MPFVLCHNLHTFSRTSQLRSFGGCAMWLGDSEQLFPVFQSCYPGLFRVFSRLTKNLCITVHFWGIVMPTSVDVTRTFCLELPVVLDLTSCSPKSIIGLRSTTEKLGVNKWVGRQNMLFSQVEISVECKTFAPSVSNNCSDSTSGVWSQPGKYDSSPSRKTPNSVTIG